MAIISGRLDELKDGDSITMNLYRFGEFQGCSLSKSSFKSVVEQGRFSFEIPIDDHPQYIDLFAPLAPKFRISSYLLEAGDRIVISESDGKITYSGKGSEKWRIKDETDTFITKYAPAKNLSENDVKELIGSFNNYIEKACAKITRERYRLGPVVTGILTADILGSACHARFMELFDFYKGIAAYRPSLQNYRHSSRNVLRLGSRGMQYSDYYAYGIIEEYKLDSCFLTGKIYNPAAAYRCLKKRYEKTPAFRERVLTLLLYTSRNNGLESYTLDDAVTTVSDPLYRRLLYELKASSVNGAAAADFALPDTSQNLVRLSDFRNKVILVDFWFSTCGPCKSLGLILNQLEKNFVGKQIVFISVSVDKTRGRWISAVRKKEFITDYSVNLFTEGKALNHPIAKHYNINGCPTLLLIDRDGKINNSFVDPHEDNGAALISTINKMLTK
ncbi:TlpA family protein disulfide reductase [Mucilaginibacter sp. SMC90]|uniref:TlpA family protein disulfide reductase n=1 Tax=Mucilaginibacter sp. SMC90 TaxID=2929803 RepID=UPI001FB4484C|nr:TlpA disulfide reductase family protein [Mucilaginibacter sp. SMC90]UOE47850.1 TlpA family protein disulfide reductase [Mucilaginibacter sp. SMC90]